MASFFLSVCLSLFLFFYATDGDEIRNLIVGWIWTEVGIFSAGLLATSCGALWLHYAAHALIPRQPRLESSSSRTGPPRTCWGKLWAGVLGQIRLGQCFVCCCCPMHLFCCCKPKPWTKLVHKEAAHAYYEHWQTGELTREWDVAAMGGQVRIADDIDDDDDDDDDDDIDDDDDGDDLSTGMGRGLEHNAISAQPRGLPRPMGSRGQVRRRAAERLLPLGQTHAPAPANLCCCRRRE